jgi:hypothetical protein
MSKTLFVGQLEKKARKSGKVYYGGYFGNVPVVGLVGKKDANKIHLVLDADNIAYLKAKGGDKQETTATCKVKPEKMAG